jgi:hypothetical protein
VYSIRMIEKTNAFKVGDQSFLTLEQAQKHEIRNLLELDPQIVTLDRKEIADWVVQYKDVIVDILTTSASSKPKARKINGGTKRRKVILNNTSPVTT